MKKCLLCLSIVSPLFLLGCTPKIEYRMVEVPVYVPIPETMLEPMLAIPPPNKEIYMSASVEKRLELWTQAYTESLFQIRAGNLRLLKLRELNDSIVKENP